MDSKGHYIKECLVSKPPTMGNLASHSHERLKNTRRNKENGRRRTPTLVSFALLRALAD